MAGDVLALHPSADQHGMSEICAKDAGFCFMPEGEGKIAGTAAKIENYGISALKDGAEVPCCASAPEAIQFERQEMVQKIVARRNLREHLADFFGGVRFGNSAFGTSSLHWRGNFTHCDSLWPPPAAIKRGVKCSTRSTA